MSSLSLPTLAKEVAKQLQEVAKQLENSNKDNIELIQENAELKKVCKIYEDSVYKLTGRKARPDKRDEPINVSKSLAFGLEEKQKELMDEIEKLKEENEKLKKEKK